MSRNPLQEWHEEFWRKVVEIVKAEKLTLESITEFFKYENLSRRYTEFCPLFPQNTICHRKPSVADFNCLFCACPYFEFELWDDDAKMFGGCRLHSRLGKRNDYGYWDCTDCWFVHRSEWVQKHLSLLPEMVIEALKRNRNET